MCVLYASSAGSPAHKVAAWGSLAPKPGGITPGLTKPVSIAGVKACDLWAKSLTKQGAGSFGLAPADLGRVKQALAW